MKDPLPLHIFLADDDVDDCLLFQEALDELSLGVQLFTVHDGEQLMDQLIKSNDALPDIIYLDLNMPRKNGFACLHEIKNDETLKSTPVIIFSTSFDQANADLLYKNGAHYYICKPTEFSQLKKVIHSSVQLILEDPSQPPKEKFLLSNLKKILL